MYGFVIDEVFNISRGDLFRFVDVKGGVEGSGSGEFPREFERKVKKVNTILIASISQLPYILQTLL